MLVLLTTVKSRGGLSNPSQAVIELLLVTETVFRNAGSRLLETTDVENYIVKLVDDQITHSSQQPSCHDVLHLIIRRYVRLRLHAHATALSKRRTSGQFASRSAAARTLVR